MPRESSNSSTARFVSAASAAIGWRSTAIRDLAARPEQIGVIVQTITGTAEQTNLLAVNAAIEAARRPSRAGGLQSSPRRFASWPRRPNGGGEVLGADRRDPDRNQLRRRGGRGRCQAHRGGRDRGRADPRGVAEDRLLGRGHDHQNRADRCGLRADRRQRPEHARKRERDRVGGAEESSACTEEVSASTEETSGSAEQGAASAQEPSATPRNSATCSHGSNSRPDASPPMG